MENSGTNKAALRKQYILPIEHDVPLDLLTDDLGEPSPHTYTCVQVKVHTLEEAKGALLKERNGTPDEKGNRIVIIKLLISGQRYAKYANSSCLVVREVDANLKMSRCCCCCCCWKL
jgi:hypothetical protein